MNGGRMGFRLAAGLIIVAIMAVPCLAQSEATPTPPAPPPAAEKAPAPAGGESGLKIAQAVICQDVVDRNPVQPGDTFPGQVGALYCFTLVQGAAGETQVTHNWYHQGTLKASIQLPVRGANWRTWSKKTILPEWTGEWMVEILGEDGKPLESVVFHIE